MKLTNEDFNRLWDNSMTWGKEWQVKGERFEPVVSYEWARAFWFYSYSSLLMARSYLNDSSYETQTTYDEGTDSWLLLTNYNFEEESANA